MTPPTHPTPVATYQWMAWQATKKRAKTYCLGQIAMYSNKDAWQPLPLWGVLGH